MTKVLTRRDVLHLADGFVVCRAAKAPTGGFVPERVLTSKLSSLEEAQQQLSAIRKSVKHARPIRLFAYFDVED
jgi:hypothetical protein